MDDIIISFFGVDNQISRGFVFGIVHVSIMLLGYYSGFSINRLLKILSNGYIAGIIGAGIAHVLADLIAALIDPSMRPATLGIVIGGLLPLYGVILFGAFIFLCVGFFLGSLAKTQESIRPLVLLFTFPQLILSGIFFPISYLPVLIQPIASSLPLSVIASTMRSISNDGGALFAINFNFLGIIFWAFLSFFFSTKFFIWQKVAS